MSTLFIRPCQSHSLGELPPQKNAQKTPPFGDHVVFEIWLSHVSGNGTIGDRKSSYTSEIQFNQKGLSQVKRGARGCDLAPKSRANTLSLRRSPVPIFPDRIASRRSFTTCSLMVRTSICFRRNVSLNISFNSINSAKPSVFSIQSCPCLNPGSNVFLGNYK